MAWNVSPKRSSAYKNFYMSIGNVERYKFTSQSIFDLLSDYCDLLIVGKDKTDKNNFYDVFLILLTIRGGLKQKRSSIEKILNDFFKDTVTVFHLELKNLRRAIKSFADEDLSWKGCVANDFNDSIKRLIYAKGLMGKQMNILDPFVQSNARQFKLIEQTVEAYNSKVFVNRLFPFKYVLDENGLEKKFGNWRDDVVAFLNDWIINGWHYKKKHLCLFGDSDSGKTTFCNALLGNYDHQNFLIGINESKFAFDRWNPFLFTHCIVDQFDFSELDINTWKIALEGAPFKINRKHKTSCYGAIQVPIILICNKRKKAFDDPAIYNSFKFVECSLRENEKIDNIKNYLYADEDFKDHKLNRNNYHKSKKANTFLQIQVQALKF
ncbi:hypothetical protein BpHYR1_014178 [Brachionus plicatilis]|uniref:SF3 helicase domain-containing protein n=1 Tax=Brachionus plicatilis TaxID=10195 RepID=A0A3M7SFR1_BRAPC|nr:hypothetical protein BpHYR1_014178 [Brachionus plicatilis]